MPAKLPEQLLRTEERRLSELCIGERGRIEAVVMRVDDLGECYLDPKAALRLMTLVPLTIQVERREDGFHVTAHSKCSSKKRPFDPDLLKSWIPVVSVTINDESSGA
jgi:hypothetical protein